MPKSIPFILRRKDTLFFRIGVPKELRPIIGCREILRSLHTTNRKTAEPFALELAAKAKRLFLTVRNDMAKNKDDSISTELITRIFNTEGNKIFEVEGDDSEKDSMNSSLETFMNNDKRRDSYQRPVDEISKKETSLQLSKIINDFLNAPVRSKKEPMLKKYKSVLPLFLEIIGDKAINELKQSDINNFFNVVQKLPPRWANAKRRERLSVIELSKLEHSQVIAPATIKGTFKACINTFLKDAARNWQDDGFPRHLTANGIEYEGSREAGENRQRALTLPELQRLFEGDEMKSFAQDYKYAHHYWLTHIGLFTGARVNEICQLNPQTDILEEPDTGIWYFWITDKTEADEHITKSIKNKESYRKVPIHKKLSELGFVTYFERVKSLGAKLIFPQWKPSRGKASSGAEKWFRTFLKEINLRDETPHNRVVGMHAFRSTFSSMAQDSGVDESSIVGHAGSGTSVGHGYRGELSLANKKAILEQINFDIEFITPAQ